MGRAAPGAHRQTDSTSEAESRNTVEGFRESSAEANNAILKSKKKEGMVRDASEKRFQLPLKAFAECRVPESESQLYVAGERIKIFLALLPSVVHLDTLPGSESFAFRISRTGGFSRPSIYLELKAQF